MNFWYLSAACIFGLAYLGFATVFGLFLVGWLKKRFAHNLPEDFWMCAPILGVLAHVSFSLLIYCIDRNASGLALWILVGGMAVFPRLAISNLRWSGAQLRPFLLCAAYSFICFAILVAYHYGPGRGNDWFWTIYQLTTVSPGDSPQAMFQAQYLLHGNSLVGAELFSIFDRPFLGGYITLFSLASIGVHPSAVFYEKSELVSILYLYLWFALNSLFCLGLFSLARKFKLGARSGIVFFVVLASPLVVFNVIGTWPKLFSTYILICSFVFAFDGRRKIALALSGVSFFTHGSFLWAHLALTFALLFLYVFNEEKSARNKAGEVIKILFLALSFPAVWFIAENLTGHVSPLKSYYLYDVSPSYGLEHSSREMAENFYRSTTIGNLTLLPFLNLVKCLLPLELLKYVVLYTYSHVEMLSGGYELASAVFSAHWNRPVFGFGFAGVFLALRGRSGALDAGSMLGLAIVAFFVLPLIPGMAIYRRDDHFVTPVMLFALIPLTLGLIKGVQVAERRFLLVALLFVMPEYLFVFLSRYPRIRYAGEFFEFYPILLSAILFFWCLLCLFSLYRVESFLSDDAVRFSGRPNPFERVGKSFSAVVVCLLILGGVAGPSVVRLAFDSPIYKFFTPDTDLLSSTSIEGFRGEQPFVNLQVASQQEGRIAWINSGQGLLFKGVKVGADFGLVGYFRLHEGWVPTRASPKLSYEVLIEWDGKAIRRKFDLPSDRKAAEKWSYFRVDLSEVSGNTVNIKLSVSASEDGVWTLAKGLRVKVNDSSDDARFELRRMEKSKRKALERLDCDQDSGDVGKDVAEACARLKGFNGELD